MGDIDFEVISAAQNSNKFQKTRFWKEKPVEDVITLEPTALATLVCMEFQKGHESGEGQYFGASKFWLGAGVETRIFYILGPHKINYWLWQGKYSMSYDLFSLRFILS